MKRKINTVTLTLNVIHKSAFQPRPSLRQHGYKQLKDHASGASTIEVQESLHSINSLYPQHLLSLPTALTATVPQRVSKL